MFKIKNQRSSGNLEFSEINVQRAVKTKRSRNGRDHLKFKNSIQVNFKMNLRDKTVKIGVRRSLNIQLATTDVINSLKRA